MNNPFLIAQATRNPQILLKMMQNTAAMSDPRARKALDMIQRRDNVGLKNMAENLCQEYGTTPDQVKQQLGNLIGM